MNYVKYKIKQANNKWVIQRVYKYVESCLWPHILTERSHVEIYNKIKWVSPSLSFFYWGFKKKQVTSICKSVIPNISGTFFTVFPLNLLFVKIYVAGVSIDSHLFCQPEVLMVWTCMFIFKKVFKCTFYSQQQIYVSNI